MNGVYGYLTEEMIRLIQRRVQGAHVWDLGAGPTLGYSEMMVKLGARAVTAIEKEPFLATPDPRIFPRRAMFHEVKPPGEGIEVAWMSWPLNRRLPGLMRLLWAAEVVIYLGSNTGGSACGTPEMFGYFRTRQLIDHFEHRQNSLLIYSKDPRTEPLVGEEYAALQGDLLTLEEARERAALFSI